MACGEREKKKPMKYFVQCTERELIVRFMIEAGGCCGESVIHVCPGEKFFYLTYDELRQAGSGVFELDESRIKEH